MDAVTQFQNYSSSPSTWWGLAAPGGTTAAESATGLASETKSDPSKTLTTYRLARQRSFRKERCNGDNGVKLAVNTNHLEICLTRGCIKSRHVPQIAGIPATGLEEMFSLFLYTG